MSVWLAKDDRQLARLWARAGLTHAEIARSLGRTVDATRYRALYRLGLPRRKRGLKPGCMPACVVPANHPVQQWAAMVRAGVSKAEIARRVGLTRQRIQQVLASR